MNERFASLLRSKWTIPTATGLSGFVLGGGITYLFTLRRVNKIVEEGDSEIEELKATQLALDFERAERDREFNEQIRRAAQVTQELREMGVNVIHNLQNLQKGEFELVAPLPRRILNEEEIAQDDETDLVDRNVFDDGWDYEAERRKRTGEEPYIIHVDEFVTEEMGYEQETLTWYDGDQVLVDQREVPIYNDKAMVGDIRWGHGSGDPNICYVRNEKLRMEFEILRDPGSYSEQDLSRRIEQRFEEADIKHMNAPQRFRDD